MHWFLLNVSVGWMAQAVPYDYRSSLECMGNPKAPLYNGGTIRNGEFNNGLMSWSAPRGVVATVSTSPSGNKFAAALSRGAQRSRSVFQKIQMQSDTHYALSAWLQVSNGTVDVKATVKAANGALVAAGAAVVKAGCWTMLKGGMTADSSGPAELFFQADAAVDMLVDSVSLQPFTAEEWKAQPFTDRTRKSSVRIVARSVDGMPLANATLGIKLSRPGFPFGNAMWKEILDTPAYEQWFASRFTVATFEDEMKWYSTEPAQGHEDYSVPDTMLQLAGKHGIRVRGHNVFWDDQKWQAGWVRPLGPAQLQAAVEERVWSAVRRYAGKVIAWDVVNENLHYNFFESRLGPDASARIYSHVGQLDRNAILFMNEFNTLEQPMDTDALPAKYAAKMGLIRAYAGNAGLRVAVGLESHFPATPNVPYMRAALDTLGQLGIPIWLTEVDVAGGPMQERYLEEVLREGYGHPSVEGIVMWAAWHARGCYVMCLTDNSFRNLPVGDVVDKLIAEWNAHPKAATADANGQVKLDLVDGQYDLTVNHPSLRAPAVRAVTVDASSSGQKHVIDIKV
ncbi:unnamed protein product [Urochloa decumbens]|uniref:GH10 domain-containing protein n=1 Tax=Urochloa decumbens TaxID=240449 RepID=A0ABC8YC83_9POAL